MLTTRRADGHLVSRPMQTQERETGLDLWFMTNVETHKLDDLMADPHVNLAYYKDRSREWVSVAGLATVSTDQDLVRELYKPDWKAWLGDEGGDRDGSANDPRIALILVEAESVVNATGVWADRLRPQEVLAEEDVPRISPRYSANR